MTGRQGRTTYDVIIVGMGPAGASAAAALSRGGLAVLGLDKDTHPRYKVCGGGLSARIEQLLEPGFRSVVEQTIKGVQFVHRGRDPLLIESSEAIAYMVMRDRFDHYLVQQAIHAGTDIRTGDSVEGITQDSTGVEVLTGQRRFRAHVVIGADGANSLVARQLFPNRSQYRAPALESEVQIGEGRHFPGSTTILVDVGAARQGYGWIFPKRECLSVGVGEFRRKATNLRATFERFVKEERGLSGWEVPRPVGHPIPAYSEAERNQRSEGCSTFVNGRAALIGDAGHLVDPLFGEGIYYAVRSGQMVARAILADKQVCAESLLAYEAALEREILPDFRVTGRIASVVYAFPRLAFKLLRRYQEVVQAYFRVLQGHTTAAQFLPDAKQRLKASVNDLLLEALQMR
ncbi:MAG: geranylgeranyl reductase family protein [Nitrospira sp.]|uniref:Geranylgeranyl reductase family protein n=1 Tax=Nitrospira defluvii TaxID=330214 RepID=A0ABM8QGK3_9BACT|nr:geranylgeranyl reductase family protein [Nitrospira defluvii]MCS6326105.1 geranylgeranyl reductase family protein [Nitrospira sp.]CAE6696065.1 Geranylgeranyl reductase family protein [Nitrospira defluvii]